MRGKIGTDIFGNAHKLLPYYVAAYTLYRLDYAFRNRKIDSIYKPARFHFLMALRILIAGNDMPPMNSHAIDRYCEQITAVLWEPDGWEEALNLAINAIIDAVAEIEPFDRDTMRTQQCTLAMLKACGVALEGQRGS